MLGKILVVLFILVMGFFTWCTCKAASWADQEEERLRSEKDEKEDL